MNTLTILFYFIGTSIIIQILLFIITNIICKIQGYKGWVKYGAYASFVDLKTGYPVFLSRNLRNFLTGGKSKLTDHVWSATDTTSHISIFCRRENKNKISEEEFERVKEITNKLLDELKSQMTYIV